jgi:hypothetical protein
MLSEESVKQQTGLRRHDLSLQRSNGSPATLTTHVSSTPPTPVEPIKSSSSVVPGWPLKSTLERLSQIFHQARSLRDITENAWLMQHFDIAICHPPKVCITIPLV